MEKIKKAISEAKKVNKQKGGETELVELREDGTVKTKDGKILKKVVLGKTKVADEKDGMDWELVEKKKTVMVVLEESD
jgi:hypothetical protein